MIITLASSKGGGDTVHIVDLDSNRTVSRWFSDPARRPDAITISAPDPASLTDHLSELAATTAPDLILIDIAGSYERALTVAVARAHLTLIPAAPTEADIFEASRVARHITSVFEAFGRDPLYRLLLNRVQPLSSGAQLYATLEIVRLRLPRIKTRVLQRAAYEELGLSGQPPHFADKKRPTVAKAIEELNEVRRDIEELLQAHYLQPSLEGAA